MIDKIRYLFHTGGTTLVVLLVAGVVALTVLLDRLWMLRGLVVSARDLASSWRDMLATGRQNLCFEMCRQSKHPLARLVIAFADRPDRPASVRLAALERARARLQARWKRPLWILGTLGATMPFVGLLGTVLGIMDAFQALGKAEDASIKVVGPGIAEALICTAVGIGVAVLCLAGYNYLQVRLQRIQAEFKWLSDELFEESMLPGSKTEER